MTVLRPKPQDTSEQAGVGPLDYTSLPGLEDVLLEDSLVIEIVESASFLSFTLLAALSPTHPAYEEPSPRDRYCFRNAALTFPRPRKVTWQERTDRRFRDATGMVDRGNIDALLADPGGFYHLEGDFGVVDVVSGAPQLDVLATQSRARALRTEQLAAWMDGRPMPERAEGDERDEAGGGHHHDHEHGHDHGHPHPHRR